MLRISTLNYNTSTVSDTLFSVSVNQWNTIASLSNQLTLSISLKDNLFVGGTASIVSLNVNDGQIYNNTTNGRVGINTSTPQTTFDVVGTTRIRTLSSNAYMDVSPNVNNDGLATMLRFLTSPDGSVVDSSRIYYQNGNPSQVYSGDIYTRCAVYSTDLYTTQSNNDASILGLQGFTGARPINYYQIMNTVDSTRISASAFGMYFPYLSLSNLSHQVYPNVLAFGFVNGGTDPDVPFTLHCGSGTGTGDSYGGGLQVTNHNNYSLFTSRLPYDVALRANGNATVTGSISANDFFVGGVSSVNTLFTSFVSLSAYTSSVNASLMSLSNIISTRNVSFLSLSGYVSSVNVSLLSLSNFVDSFTIGFGAQTTTLLTNTVVSNTTNYTWYYNFWTILRSSGESYSVRMSSAAFTAGSGTTRLVDRFDTGAQATTYFVKLNFAVPAGWHFCISSTVSTTFDGARFA